MKDEKVCAFRVNMINSDVLKQLKQLEKDKYIERINVGKYEDVNEDKVHVIYLDGKKLDKMGRKTVYLKIGGAKQVVSSESIHMAELKYGCDWYELKKSEQEKLINEQRKRFEIKDFTEKCQLR